MQTTNSFYTAPPFVKKEITEGFLAGNKKSFSALYDAYSSTIFKLILLKVKDIQASEKILELTFVEAWNRRHEYRAWEKEIVAWLYYISRGFLPG